MLRPHCGPTLRLKAPSPLMTELSQTLSIRPYGERWAILVGDEVVLVSNSRKAAETVVAKAVDVLEQSGIASEPRSFASRED